MTYSPIDEEIITRAKKLVEEHLADKNYNVDQFSSDMCASRMTLYRKIHSITELTNTTGYGTGYFAPLKFGVDDCNHAWIGWGVDDIFGAPKFGIGTGSQRLVSEGRYCCGFSFVTKGYKEGGYTTIYQFNYNNKFKDAKWSLPEDSGASEDSQGSASQRQRGCTASGGLRSCPDRS